jgi:hypothetical protein
VKSWCALACAAVALLSSWFAWAAPPAAAPAPSDLAFQPPAGSLAPPPAAGNPPGSPPPPVGNPAPAVGNPARRVSAPASSDLAFQPGAGGPAPPPAAGNSPPAAGTPAPEVPASKPAPPLASPPAVSTKHPQSPKRQVPDYSGRGPDPTTGGEVALWVPRVILSPVYFVSEFIVRRPLSVVVPPIDKANIPRKTYDFFVFGVDHKAGILPSGYIDFNSIPNVGLYAFWNDALVNGHDLAFRFTGWPTDVLQTSASERMHFSQARTLGLTVVGYVRPDHMFFGLGPSSTENHRSRYGAASVDGSVLFSKGLWRASKIETTFGLRDVRTYDGHFGTDPSLTAEAATGAFPIPYGFQEQYTLAYSRILAALDTRRAYPFSGSGVLLEAQGEQDSAWNPSPGSTPVNEWFKYGATLGGYWDLNGYRRVLSLVVNLLFADPIGSQAIPFTELVALGGDGPMRGFYPGRLVDRSAAVATLRYTWPVGPWIDADLTFAVGNVFGAQLNGFQAGLLRLSGTVGFALTGISGLPVEFLIGTGTETFEDGTHLNTVHALVGVNRF